MSVESLAYRLGCLFHWPDREVAIRSGLKALPDSVLQGARLLDVGSGLGQLSRVARECGLDYVGLEPDAGFRQEASRNFPGTAFVDRGADHISDEIHPEDLVVLNGVAHHLDNRLLETVVAASRRGRGLLICDHLRLDGETHALARFLQDLDRGKFVRRYEDLQLPPDFVRRSTRFFPVGPFGTSWWTFFCDIYTTS